MDNLKRKLAKKDESTAKKQIMLGAKFKSNGNGIRGERADRRNVDTVAIWETAYAAQGASGRTIN